MLTIRQFLTQGTPLNKHGRAVVYSAIFAVGLFDLRARRPKGIIVPRRCPAAFRLMCPVFRAVGLFVLRRCWPWQTSYSTSVSMWLRDVPSPCVHNLAALLQQVRAPVGRFDGVLDDVREARLG